MDCFLSDGDLHHERLRTFITIPVTKTPEYRTTGTRALTNNLRTGMQEDKTGTPEQRAIWLGPLTTTSGPCKSKPIL